LPFYVVLRRTDATGAWRKQRGQQTLVLADNGFRFEHHPSWGPIPRGAYKVYATQVLIYTVYYQMNLILQLMFDICTHILVFFSLFTAHVFTQLRFYKQI